MQTTPGRVSGRACAERTVDYRTTRCLPLKRQCSVHACRQGIGDCDGRERTRNRCPGSTKDTITINGLRLWKENFSKESCPITFRFAFDGAPTRQFTREVVSARAAHVRHNASGTLIPSFAASLREVKRATSSWAKPSYLACEFPSETVGVNN
jgi:hypothetical protein